MYKKRLKDLILKAIYFLENLIPRHRSTSPSRILVYGYMGIGNMILFLPALRALKEAFPSAIITLETDTKRKCDELVKDTPWIDYINYFDYDKSNLREKFSLILSYWKEGYDTILTNFHFPQGLLWGFAGLVIPRRIGPVSSFLGEMSCCFTDKVCIDHIQHELDMNFELIKVLGINPETNNKVTEIAINDAELEATQFIQQYPAITERINIAISAGVMKGQEWKQWPMERMAELARSLIKTNKFNIIVLGSPSERLVNINYFGPDSEYLVHSAGKISLKGTAALIKKCHLIVANDSGLLHVASAVGTPILMIAGPTNIARSKPVSSSIKIITHALDCQPCYTFFDDSKVVACVHRNCLMGITVDDVIKNITEIL